MCRRLAGGMASSALVPVAQVESELRDRELQPIGRSPVLGIRRLEPLERSLEGLVRAAREVEDVRDVDPGAALLHLETLLASDLERLAQVGHALVDLAALAEGRAERIESDRLGLAVAHRARHAERLARGLGRLGKARLHHAASRELGEQLRARGARLVRQQREPLAQRLERVVLPVLAPERLAEPLLDQRGAAGIGVGVHELERAPQQGLLAGRVAGLIRGHGGVAQKLELVDSCELFRIGHPLPQRERTLKQRLGLGEGVHALGGQPGPRRGRERPRLVAGRGPVVRRLRGDVRASLAALDSLLELAGEGGVHLCPLSRQQVLVHHLAQQSVAEAVALVAHGHHDVARHGLAQRIAKIGGLEARHGRHEQSGRRRAGRRASGSAPARAGTAAPRAASARRAGSAAALHARRVRRRGSPRRTGRFPRCASTRAARARRRGGSPTMPSSCSPSSSGEKRGSSIRRMYGSLESSASSGLSGWRRWSSSER